MIILLVMLMQVIMERLAGTRKRAAQRQ